MLYINISSGIIKNKLYNLKEVDQLWQEQKRSQDSLQQKRSFQRFCKVDDIISAKTAELKELKAKKRSLNKLLSEAEERENEEKNKETLDRVVSLMKKKGISVDDVEAMLNKK